MDQIAFIDKFIHLFGVNGVTDHESTINRNNIDEDIIIKHVNKNMNLIKKLFKTGSMNLSRKDYKVDSIDLAIAVLRHCLKQANIPFEIIHTKNGNEMRLIPQNNLLLKYIENKMNYDIHLNEKEKIEPIKELVVKDFLKKFTIHNLVNANCEMQRSMGLHDVMDVGIAKPSSEMTVHEWTELPAHYIVPQWNDVCLKEIVMYDIKDSYLCAIPMHRIADTINDINCIIIKKVDKLCEVVDNVIKRSSLMLIDLSANQFKTICSDFTKLRTNPIAFCVPYFPMILVLELDKKLVDIENMVIRIENKVGFIMNNNDRRAVMTAKKLVYDDFTIQITNVDKDNKPICNIDIDTKLEWKKNMFDYEKNKIRYITKTKTIDLYLNVWLWHNITSINVCVINNEGNLVQNIISKCELVVNDHMRDYGNNNIGHNDVDCPPTKTIFSRTIQQTKKNSSHDLNVTNIRTHSLITSWNDIQLKFETSYELPKDQMIMVEITYEYSTDNTNNKMCDGYIVDGRYIDKKDHKDQEDRKIKK